MKEFQLRRGALELVVEHVDDAAFARRFSLPNPFAQVIIYTIESEDRHHQAKRGVSFPMEPAQARGVALALLGRDPETLPVEIADVDGEIVRVSLDLERPLVWLTQSPPPGPRAMSAACLDPVAACALGRALIAAGEAAQAPKTKEE